jgi:hypothetical protein
MATVEDCEARRRAGAGGAAAAAAAAAAGWSIGGGGGGRRAAEDDARADEATLDGAAAAKREGRVSEPRKPRNRLTRTISLMFVGGRRMQEVSRLRDCASDVWQ